MWGGAADAEQRRLDAARNAMRLAVEKAKRALIGSVRSSHEALHRALVKAFDQIIDDARRVAPALEGFDLRDRAQFLDQPDSVRRAFRKYEAAAQRFQSILAARRHVRQLTSGEPRVDMSGQFALVHNADSVQHARSKTPIELLYWLVTSDADPWASQRRRAGRGDHCRARTTCCRRRQPTGRGGPLAGALTNSAGSRLPWASVVLIAAVPEFGDEGVYAFIRRARYECGPVSDGHIGRCLE